MGSIACNSKTIMSWWFGGQGVLARAQGVAEREGRKWSCLEFWAAATGKQPLPAQKVRGAGWQHSSVPFPKPSSSKKKGRYDD